VDLGSLFITYTLRYAVVSIFNLVLILLRTVYQWQSRVRCLLLISATYNIRRWKSQQIPPQQ